MLLTLLLVVLVGGAAMPAAGKLAGEVADRAPEDVAGAEGELERLQAEARRLEAELERLSATDAAVLLRLDALTASRDLAAARAQVATNRLLRLAARAAAAARRRATAESRQAASEDALRRRLVALRRGGPGQRVLAVVGAQRPAATLAALRMVSDRAELDRLSAAAARADRDAAREAARQLAARRAEVDAAATREEAARSRAAQAMAAQEERLDDIRRQESLFREAMAELMRAGSDLQAFIEGRIPTRPPGPDLRALKGTLAWPAQGSVTIGFGPRRHPRFGTRVPHNGISIGAAEGSPCSSVAAGRVIFADWFHGYGRTVILDHGDGVMTVSAHLATIGVRPGQTVGPGELLGTVGDTGSLDGTELYFEIRENARPRPPLEWLAPAPGDG
ncbi:MAG: murein hydrolase activator EnvC family protein [Acidobacteriota bacterium]